MKLLKHIALVAALATASVAQAQDIRIGMILPMSGPFGAHGTQAENGARLYMKLHGNTVAGHTLHVILKDDTGIAPAVSKREAQELLTKDKVSILTGFGMTPSAFAVAPLATETHTPMVIMNAATSSITTKSDYIVRTSFTLPQITAPIAMWAAKNGIKSVYTIVADYGPGHDSEAEFVKVFTGAGGHIVGQARTPTQSPDFAPFLQKAKDAKPDAIFVMLPAGEQAVAFMKGYHEKELEKAGIRLVTTGDLNDEGVLAALGNSALGLTTSFHYAQAHDSPENKAFVAAYTKAYPGQRPNFWSVGAYDAMHLIYETLKKTKGNTNGDVFMAAAKGMQWQSPRGPVSIDPATRDIVQNVYIRKTERVHGMLQNVEFDKVANFKDPGK